MKKVEKIKKRVLEVNIYIIKQNIKNMKYIKTFENYDAQSGKEFPELQNSPEQKKVLSDAFEKLSPEEQEAAYKGVEELAAKLGCTVEDLTDPSFLEKDLQEAGAQSVVEEGLFGDMAARTKKFFGNLLNGLGVVLRWGGGLSGILTTVLGIAAGSPDCRIDWMWNEALRSLTVNQQAGMFVGGLAALGISVIAGHMLSRKGKEMAR